MIPSVNLLLSGPNPWTNRAASSLASPSHFLYIKTQTDPIIPSLFESLQ